MEGNCAGESFVRDRYLALIEQMVTKILQGQLLSKAHVVRQLGEQIEPGTGEVFTACLTEKATEIAAQVAQATDELRQAKASRRQRAMHTIESAWAEYCAERQATDAIAAATRAILSAPAGERLLPWLLALDENLAQPLKRSQLAQLMQTLEMGQSGDDEITQLHQGMQRGLATYKEIEPHLIDWMYDQSQRAIGFEGVPGRVGPWEPWSQQISSPILTRFFQGLARQQPLSDWLTQSAITLADWVELTLVLLYTQRGLVKWFEQQPYDSRWGTAQSIATYLTFAALWGQLMQGVTSGSPSATVLRQAAFQSALQVLRRFSQRPYFPLYGGVFALFTGDYLGTALAYLDAPLASAEGTQEKARILTLLGYSQRTLGHLEQAIAFHEQALAMAQQAADTPCEIANLNHLSRTHLAQKRYSEAAAYSQRALILARQRGDRLGEANALANYGFSQVLTAQQLEGILPESAEMAIQQLQQGLALSVQVGDRQSEALCCNSLGTAYTLQQQYAAAVPLLQQGIQAAERAGDLFLQGLSWAYLGEAAYHSQDRALSLPALLLGLYWLDVLQTQERSQPLGLLRILKGQLGTEGFQAAVRASQSMLLPRIGVDGIDHVQSLLREPLAE